MGENNDIPIGTYTLELGKSFGSGDGKRNSSPAPQIHTLRYDYKPKTNGNETYIAFGGSPGEVHVALPTEGENLTVFKGSKKEAKPKECLLFFDSRTNTVRLEKINSNIVVKKTRDLEQTTEASLRQGIERLRTNSTSQPQQPQPSYSAPQNDSKPQQEPPKQRKESSSSSSSSSGSDSSSDDDSDDNEKNASSDSEDEQKILAHLKSAQAEPPIAPLADDFFQNMPSFEQQQQQKAAASKPSNCGHEYGLALSESSDDDSD